MSRSGSCIGEIFIDRAKAAPVRTWLRQCHPEWRFYVNPNRNQPATEILSVYGPPDTDALQQTLVLKAALREAFPDAPWQDCWLNYDEIEPGKWVRAAPTATVAPTVPERT